MHCLERRIHSNDCLPRYHEGTPKSRALLFLVAMSLWRTGSGIAVPSAYFGRGSGLFVLPPFSDCTADLNATLQTLRLRWSLTFPYLTISCSSRVSTTKMGYPRLPHTFLKPFPPTRGEEMSRCASPLLSKGWGGPSSCVRN